MYSTRIYYQDTDAGGVVYFANYLKFIEKSWFEYLMSIGISIPAWEEIGTYMIIKNVSLDLMEPLKYGDTISVKTDISLDVGKPRDAQVIVVLRTRPSQSTGETSS